MGTTNNNIGNKANEVYELLFKGKKVTTAGERKISYFENWNHPDATKSSSSNTRRTDILYFWANPQMNRLFGKLADGRQVDIELGFLDLYSHTFMEYIEEPKPDSWRNIFDAKKMSPESWRKCLSTARELNYPYICWNGRIYSTKDSYQAFPICTEEEM
jgi:hypothetical protein